jgi:hypothetical protein
MRADDVTDVLRTGSQTADVEAPFGRTLALQCLFHPEPAMWESETHESGISVVAASSPIVES